MDYQIPALTLGDLWYAYDSDTDPDKPSATEAFGVGSLWDHFGLPLYQSGAQPNNDLTNYIDVRPFRAYHLICNEWFRNQSLVDPLLVSKSDTADWTEYTGLWRADKRRDMFSSALPLPQKGPAVPLPLVQGDYAPVLTRNAEIPKDANSPGLRFRNVSSNNATGNATFRTDSVGAVQAVANASGTGVTQVQPANLWIDLTSAYAADINAFRLAFATQRVFEALARGGSRYTEFVRTFFHLIMPDAVAMRPEYLGGACVRHSMKQVAQTSGSTEESLLGQLGAYSMTASRKKAFHRNFGEHGFLIQVAVTRVDHTYSQGIERFWTRRNRFDLYLQPFAHLGEMPIYNRELYYDVGFPDVAGEVFGYRPPWDEYRHIPSRVTGCFRPELQNGYQAWTYSDYYTTTPKLSEEWIKEPSTNVGQTLATAEEEFQFIGVFAADILALRPMPAYPLPGLIDHF